MKPQPKTKEYFNIISTWVAANLANYTDQDKAEAEQFEYNGLPKRCFIELIGQGRIKEKDPTKLRHEWRNRLKARHADSQALVIAGTFHLKAVAEDDQHPPPQDLTKHVEALKLRRAEAAAKSAEEKAKQEELKTLIMKAKLADLINKTVDKGRKTHVDVCEFADELCYPTEEAEANALKTSSDTPLVANNNGGGGGRSANHSSTPIVSANNDNNVESLIDDEQRQQQLVEQLANYTEKLNNWSFDTADHQVDDLLDQVDAKMSLVDLSKNYWNTRDYQNPSVNGRTVSSCIAGYDAIRTMFGYSTSVLAVPNNSHNFKVYYAEFLILAMPEKFIFIGLAPSNFPVREILGSLPNTYSINKKGTLHCAGDVKAGFLPNGFAQGDTIGCGLVMTKCPNCDPCRLFFTKNGQILDTPLAISPTCSELFPTISFHGAGSKVCANFGNEPFKYAIPPAKGLLCGVRGFCCCCEKN